MNLSKSKTKRVETPPVNHICDHCNKDINSLTYKLQQHPSSHVWLKHGQCCAACVATGDIRVANNDKEFIVEKRIPYDERIREEGSHRKNVLLAFSRAAELEDKTGAKLRRKTQNSITAGKVIGAAGFAAGLIFTYFEMFFLAGGSILFGIAVIVICRLGICK